MTSLQGKTAVATGGRAEFIRLDLADLESVRACAKALWLVTCRSTSS
jgi:hypothetical protein